MKVQAPVLTELMKIGREPIVLSLNRDLFPLQVSTQCAGIGVTIDMVSGAVRVFAHGDESREALQQFTHELLGAALDRA